MALGLAAEAQISQHCAANKVCFGLNIPETTAQSSNGGNVFISMQAPTTYSWVGLGMGSSMSSADMLVLYTDGKGNVTVSPRLSSDHRQPRFDGSLGVKLLEGSGVANGIMTANIQCGNCARTGRMDFRGDSGNWIYASQSGAPLDSSNVEENISIHSDNGAFEWNFRPAVGGQSANPFRQANANVTTGAASSSGNSGSNRATIILCHGVLASIAFLVLFPAGAVVMRLGNFKGLIWIHAGIQLLAWMVFVAAFGLGLYYGIQINLMTQAHPIIGIVLIVLVTVQPLLGWVHHKQFVRTGGRGAASQGHIWMGRVAIILGMINGGLGLQLARVSKRYVVAYSVVAGVMGLVYVTSIVLGELRRSRRGSTTGSETDGITGTGNKGEKVARSPDRTSEGA